MIRVKIEELVNIVVVIFFIAGFLLLICCDQSVTGFTVKDFGSLEIDGEIDVVVTLKDGSFYSLKDNIKTQQDKFVKLNDLELKNDYDNINALSLRVNKSDVEKIINDPNLESITFDQVFKVTLDSSKSIVKADQVWDKLSENVNLTGSGSVCVLDTGVDYNHDNLKGRIISGYDFVNNDDDAMDDHGHGTHVAGIVVSNDSINRGIAFGGNVVAVKTMNSGGTGTGANIIGGIDWCINNKDLYNISVISMSIGSDTLFSSICDDAYQELTNIINQAVLNNILVVSASANNYNPGALPLPACISNCTSVGAVDDNDNIASFSNSASFLDLLAPGVGITSIQLSGGFVTHSGTSMATPYVSAAVLLMKQYSDLDVFSLYDVLMNTGDEVLDSRNGYTFSRLNVFKALVSLDSFEPVLSFEIIGDLYDDKNITLSGSAIDTFLDSIWLEIGNITYDNNHVLSGLDAGDNINFVFYANDSAGNLASNSSGFVVLDGSPVLEDIEMLKAQTNKAFSYQVTASDPTDDILVYNDNTELFDIGDTGLISFIPETAGNYSINISVSDGKHLIKDEFILEVWLNNSAPEIVSYIPVNLSLSLDENESLEFSIVVEDLDNTSLSYDWYLDGNPVSNNDNYLFETDYSSAGNYNITTVVSDGIDSDSLEWNIIVNDVNLVPVLIGLIGNVSFNENTNYSLDLSPFFKDLDGDSLGYNMSDVENISFDNSLLTSDLNFVGNRELRFYAYDPDVNFVESNIVGLTVSNVPVCGDCLLEGDEECDLSSLDNKSCLDFDYDSGSLGCDSECKFDYSGCVINSPPSSSGSAPSGGGGTHFDEGENIQVEEKTEQVKGEVKASEEEKPMDGTGEIVKEHEIKPKVSRIKTLFVKVGSFFKFIWYKVVSLFR